MENHLIVSYRALEASWYINKLHWHTRDFNNIMNQYKDKHRNIGILDLFNPELTKERPTGIHNKS